MAIDTPSGQFRAGPRIVEIKDTRAGCPGSAANGATLASASISVASEATWWANARVIMIASSAGKQRCDLAIRVNGVLQRQSIETVTNSANANVAAWEDINASAMGVLPAGTHTFSMTGQEATNCWGCGSTWGEISIMIWEAS